MAVERRGSQLIATHQPAAKRLGTCAVWLSFDLKAFVSP